MITDQMRDAFHDVYGKTGKPPAAFNLTVEQGFQLFREVHNQSINVWSSSINETLYQIILREDEETLMKEIKGFHFMGLPIRIHRLAEPKGEQS